ncbi:hypothetical protein [Nocardioides sp.]|uniref:hypothetical protein n=1 Tax=Nocardioides sp. TaxID=35761 RepID=UPI002C98579D|nr:hypothetical protein [Nocardioides sp.]HXH77422.1 hypothetical protein [Nocardioides sp.]
MASDDFQQMIGPLKRAAIDAFMCSDSLGDLFGFQIDGDKYIHVQTGGGSATSPGLVLVKEVTRPGTDGEGGGDSKTRIPMCPDNDEPGKYADDFATIRNRIDEAIERWTWLPDPGAVTPLVESMRQANRVLSLDTVSAEGAVTGGGQIGGNIALIMESSDAMAGGMITAFKTKFLSQLGKAVAGQHAITVILGGVLAAEEKIWEGAQQTVTDLIENTTAAFNAAAEGGSVDWEVALKVVGYAAAAASIFATGGAATALKVGAVGLSILTDNVPTEGDPTTAPKADYDGVMSTFEEVLDGLATEIVNEEQILEDNLVTNLRQIQADRASFDLAAPPLIDIDDGSDLGAPSELIIEPIRVREITETYLPTIAGELKVAVVHLNQADSLSALHRDASIGLGSYGPNACYHALRNLLEELLENLQARIIYSAKALQLGAEDIGNADTKVRDALEKHADQVRDHGIYPVPQPVGPWL